MIFITEGKRNHAFKIQENSSLCVDLYYSAWLVNFSQPFLTFQWWCLNTNCVSYRQELISEIKKFPKILKSCIQKRACVLWGSHPPLSLKIPIEFSHKLSFFGPPLACLVWRITSSFWMWSEKWRLLPIFFSNFGRKLMLLFTTLKTLFFLSRETQGNETDRKLRLRSPPIKIAAGIVSSGWSFTLCAMLSS